MKIMATTVVDPKHWYQTLIFESIQICTPPGYARELIHRVSNQKALTARSMVRRMNITVLYIPSQRRLFVVSVGPWTRWRMVAK